VNWLRINQRTAWICGLTLLVPLLLYLNALLGLWSLRQASHEEIARLEPRIARQQGLIEFEEQLRAAAQAVGSRVSDLVYPASEDRTTVAAELQSQVRDIFAEAGLSVTNSQVLPVREQGNFDYIVVKLTVSGSLPGLDEALAGIAGYLPLVLVETLDVYPARASRSKDAAPQQNITASLQLLSLRAAQ
jgi:general secretion pathway protein M